MINWVQFLSWAVPISATVVAIASIISAGRRWKTDRQDKLKLHFYEKRKEVFEACMTFISIVVRKGTVTQQDIRDLAKQLREARHLFDDDTWNACDQIYKNGLKLMTDDQVVKLPDSPNYQASVQSLAVLLPWFLEQSNTLPKQFDRYLKVSK